jgi:hypothetical protein
MSILQMVVRNDKAASTNGQSGGEDGTDGMTAARQLRERGGLRWMVTELLLRNPLPLVRRGTHAALLEVCACSPEASAYVQQLLVKCVDALVILQVEAGMSADDPQKYTTPKSGSSAAYSTAPAPNSAAAQHVSAPNCTQFFRLLEHFLEVAVDDHHHTSAVGEGGVGDGANGGSEGGGNASDLGQIDSSLCMPLDTLAPELAKAAVRCLRSFTEAVTVRPFPRELPQQASTSSGNDGRGSSVNGGAKERRRASTAATTAGGFGYWGAGTGEGADHALGGLAKLLTRLLQVAPREINRSSSDSPSRRSPPRMSNMAQPPRSFSHFAGGHPVLPRMLLKTIHNVFLMRVPTLAQALDTMHAVEVNLLERSLDYGARERSSGPICQGAGSVRWCFELLASIAMFSPEKMSELLQVCL